MIQKLKKISNFRGGGDSFGFTKNQTQSQILFCFIQGGYDSMNFLNTVERYDPIKETWDYVAPMNVKRSRMALVTW